LSFRVIEGFSNIFAGAAHYVEFDGFHGGEDNRIERGREGAQLPFTMQKERQPPSAI
jgi:hypothetical protein